MSDKPERVARLCACGKLAYETKASAKKHAGNGQRVYRCAIADVYHRASRVARRDRR